MPSPLAPQQLFTCPRCNRTGFYARGLLAHVCRGNGITDRRRRLSTIELKAAGAVVHTSELLARKGGA